MRNHAATTYALHRLAAFLPTAFSLVLALAAFGQAPGQAGGFDPEDNMDVFEKKGERPEQKEKSFWYSVSEATPDAQLAYAVKMEVSGKNRSARKGYEALVREWPAAPQAATAQLNLARFFEKQGKYEKAFDEYQYLLTYYAGLCPYNEVLADQYRLANLLLHDNRSMFGWLLSGTDAIRERFELIVRNAPRSVLAPEILLIIGGIHMSDNEREDAIRVYDTLLNRFPSATQAIPAVFLAAQCRYDLAVKNHYNEARCREAIGFFKSVLARLPQHPQKEQMQTWLKELTALLSDQNYQQAVFYDTRQRNVGAAKAAYTRFLSEFPDSPHAQQVRDRLADLEKGAPPLKK